MKKINSSQDRLKYLFSYDCNTGIFVRKIYCGGHPSGSIAGRMNAKGYIDISVDNERYFAHRLAWVYVYGGIPEDMQIDHINRLPYDNRIKNLRLATHKQNMENVGKKKSNTSGHIGVDFRCGKWRARIQHNNKPIIIGLYDDINQAIKARSDYRLRLHKYANI